MLGKRVAREAETGGAAAAEGGGAEAEAAAAAAAPPLVQREELSDAQVAEDFCTKGPRPFAEIQNMDFNDLSQFLRTSAVIDAGGNFFGRVIDECNRKAPNNKPVITGTVNAKVMLAAYLIAVRPDIVFDNPDPLSKLQQELIAASRPLVDALHATAVALQAGQDWGEIDAFRNMTHLLCDYLRKLQKWNTVEQATLEQRLTRTLQKLQDAIAKAVSDADCDEQVLTELRNQEGRVLERLMRINQGPAAAPPPQQQQQVAAPARVSKTYCNPAVAATDTGLTTEQIAHEMMLDTNFQLGHREEGSLVHTDIRRIFDDAYFESAALEVCARPPNFSAVLNMLSTIHQEIQKIAQGDINADAVVDMDRIRDQVHNQQQGFDFGSCMHLVSGIVDAVIRMHRMMKADKSRDETVSQWEGVRAEMEAAAAATAGDGDGVRARRAQSICNSLRFVLDRLHRIRQDKANYKLNALKRVIRGEAGIAYLQKAFWKRYPAEAPLPRTERWLQAAVSNQQQAAVPNQLIVHTALVRLVAEFCHAQVPETLELDLVRLEALYVHFHADVVKAIIVMQVGLSLPKNLDLDQRKGIFTQVEGILRNRKSLGSDRQKKAVIDLVADAVLVEDRQALVAITNKHVDRSHAVYKHIQNKVMEMWLRCLGHGAASAAAGRVSEEAGGETRLPDCIQPWVTDMTKIHAQALSSIALLQVLVHGRCYDVILSKILPATAALGGAAGGATRNPQQVLRGDMLATQEEDDGAEMMEEEDASADHEDDTAEHAAAFPGAGAILQEEEDQVIEDDETG